MSDWSPAIPDPSVHAEATRDRLSGIVAVTIAFATLIAAVAGFLQADSANVAGDLRDRAEQLALQALASSQTKQQNAQVELETFARWVEQRTQAGNAYLASLYAGSDPVRQNQLLLEQQRWETLAAATLTQSEIKPDSDLGPENDPIFPSRYYAAAAEESLRLNAQQDAANEAASSLDQRAASYTAILAMIAVALYLFGLTLAVAGRWLRVGFLAVGAVLLAVGSLWLLQTAVSPGPILNEQAAAEYARGRVVATTATGTADYQAAETHYTRAIQLRPTYARAYADRAGVIFQAASPQRGGYVSIAPPEALARARADLETARSLGLENASTFSDLGFYAFSQGVQGADVRLINQGIEYARRAIAIDPTEPVSRYNLGVALVAAGRFDEARVAYQDAVAATIYTDAARTVLRQAPAIEEHWVAGALTDLEIVRRYQADLERVTGRTGFEATIRTMKEYIVGQVAAQTLQPRPLSPAAFMNIEPTVFPAEVQWAGTVQNYDAARDEVSAQWYHNDTANTGWAVIPELSIPAAPSVDPNGELFNLTSYIDVVYPARCLPQGSYRVEIYVNGRLAAEGSQVADFGVYEAFLARDLTMGFCRPSDWVRLDDRFPGLIDGYRSTDRQYGAYGARYSLPGSLRSIEDITAQIEDLTVSSFSHLFPAQPTYADSFGTDTSTYFMGLSRRAWRMYDYGSGYVRVGGGETADGAVVLGMVYGPYAWFDGDEPYRILNSLVPLR